MYKFILSCCLLQLIFVAGFSQISIQNSNPVHTALPAYSQLEIDSLVIHEDGYVILNTTSGCLNYRYNDVWLELCGGCLPLPQTPVLDTLIADYDNLTLVFEKTAQTSDSRITGTLYPPEISKNLEDNTISFTGLTNGIYYVEYYSTNECGISSKIKSEQITIVSTDQCDDQEFIEFNGTDIPIGSFGQNCWQIEDNYYQLPPNLANLGYKSNQDIQYYSLKVNNKIPLCPEGWRLPTADDAENLIRYVNEEEERIAKFNPSNKGVYSKATDVVGFDVSAIYLLNSESSQVLVINKNGGMIAPAENPKAFVQVRCVKE